MDGNYIITKNDIVQVHKFRKLICILSNTLQNTSMAFSNNIRIKRFFFYIKYIQQRVDERQF